MFYLTKAFFVTILLKNGLAVAQKKTKRGISIRERKEGGFSFGPLKLVKDIFGNNGPYGLARRNGNSELNLKILLKTPSQFGLQVFFITKSYPAVLGLDKALKWNPSNFSCFFLFCASVDVGRFLPRLRPGIPQPHTNGFSYETKGFSKLSIQRVSTPPGSGPVSMTLASEIF